MSEKKLVIIDGSSMLSTCYYAVLPREIMFAKTEEEKQKHYNKILRSEDGVSFMPMTSLSFAVHIDGTDSGRRGI